MRFLNRSFLLVSLSISAISIQISAFAHNGKIAYAKPLGKITVDGKLADWPAKTTRYKIETILSETKPVNDADFSGYFQVGYRLDERALYLAIVLTDNDFMEDTTENARFNSQDCFELCLDARHAAVGSGVASFMYSKKLRNTNHAFFDPFAKAATWKIMEVAQSVNGNVRTYEWRIQLGDEMAVGKPIGLDFQFFDKDDDGSFSITGWGKGGYKFRTPGALGDIVPITDDQKFGTVHGNIAWDKKTTIRLPERVRLSQTQNEKLSLAAEVDSLGNYSLEVPAGKYSISVPDTLFFDNDKPVLISGTSAPAVVAKPGQKINAGKMLIANASLPDIIPEKGVLLDFSPAAAKKVDDYIQTYQKYYGIPGVSLALIKDGKVVYHKAYGYKNAATREKVEDNTMFEAASVTKPVFSFAVQRLAERGVIDLDRPLYLYLPYPDIANDERYKLITARHVLTHRTGFPNWRSMNADGKLNIMFTPGTSYNYSGEGFEYLKMVVEKITGKKVEQVLKEEVIEPMGLYHTYFTENDTLRRDVANGHFDMLPSPPELPAAPGMAWSMHTEPQTFTRFMLYMLEQKGLKPQMYDTMFSKHSEFKFDSKEEQPRYPSYMGMSLEIRETPFGKTFGHGGNNGDFQCHFEVYKDLKAGYVVFTNSNTSYFFLSSLRDFLVEGKAVKK